MYEIARHNKKWLSRSLRKHAVDGMGKNRYSFIAKVVLLGQIATACTGFMRRPPPDLSIQQGKSYIFGSLQVESGIIDDFNTMALILKNLDTEEVVIVPFFRNFGRIYPIELMPGRYQFQKTVVFHDRLSNPRLALGFQRQKDSPLFKVIELKPGEIVYIGSFYARGTRRIEANVGGVISISTMTLERYENSFEDDTVSLLALYPAFNNRSIRSVWREEQ